MKKILCGVLLVTYSISFAQQEWGTTAIKGPGAMQLTCQEIDGLASPPNELPETVFNVKKVDWTPTMVQFLLSTIYRCRSSLIKGLSEKQSLNDHLQDVIYARSEKMIATVQSIGKQNSLMADDLSRAQKLQEAKNNEAHAQAVVEAHRQASVCENSKEKMFFEAEDAVIQDIEIISEWKDRITQERRVSRASGVRNLTNEYDNGQGQVAAQDDLRDAWSHYKSLGGKAASPQKVKHKIKNPCSHFSDTAENQAIAQ